jgi:ubiquitin-protein ligase E3 A
MFQKFTPDEFDLLVSGESHYDWRAFKNGCRYEGGYTENSEVVRWFWEIFFGDFDDNRRRDVLLFVVGTDRIPIGGIQQMQMTIQKGGPEDGFPSSHTCFSQLVLSNYTSKHVLRQRLLLALDNCTGFGQV